MNLKIFIANLSAYASGEMIGKYHVMPADSEELEQTLTEIGVGENQEYFIPVVECDIDGLCSVIDEHESLAHVNELAEALDRLDTFEITKVEALIETETSSLPQLLCFLDTLDDVSLLPVSTDEELGEYYINEFGSLEIPKDILAYFDYEAYGRDIRLGGSGVFASSGFLII